MKNEKDDEEETENRFDFVQDNFHLADNFLYVPYTTYAYII